MTTEFSKAWNNSELVKDTKIVYITPEIALELLQTNSGNRTLKPANLAFVKNELTKDRWQITHQAIAIDLNGKLIDGQHRLEGIAKTKKSAWVRVTIGCDPQTMSAVDTGRSRSNADMLQICGTESAKNTAAVMRQFICYNCYSGIGWTGPNAIVTSVDISNEIQKFEFDVQVVFVYAAKLNRLFKPLPTTPASTFILLCKTKQIPDYEYMEFLDQLVTGDNVEKDAPTLLLRNRWINAKTKQYRHALAGRIKLAELIFAFNAYMHNKQITSKQLGSLTIQPMPLLQ